MAENSYLDALSNYNSMAEQQKQYAENFVSDAQKEIGERMDALVGGSLGMVPVVETAGKYIGKAVGKRAEGLLTKGVKAIKSKISGKSDATEGNKNDGGDGADDPDAEADTGVEPDIGTAGEGTGIEGETYNPPSGGDGGDVELSDMAGDGAESGGVSGATEQPSLGSSGAENPSLSDTGYGDLDDDGGLPQPPQEVNKPPEQEDDVDADADAGKGAEGGESAGDSGADASGGADAGASGGADAGADTGATLGADLGADAGVEAGLNSLDAIPIIGELGMVAGAIYGLVHLFHHPKPKPPPTYTMATPTMDVEGGMLNASASPMAHT